jgi:DNA invertase Pin-like site-specific DNA recombinase
MTKQDAQGWDRVAGKVEAHHRDRVAVVYVRQSTLRQIAENTESAKLQYALVERAVALGWVRSRVVVIDEDTGSSASGKQERPGFTRLVSEVGLGHVGVVLGSEMSRLARSGRDWHQLLELCALARTLLADLDGIYDPATHNDRLLLGLKGTISEAELYLIKQRMWGGRVAKARRGELGMEIPLGYVRRPSGEVVLDPDEQVQAVVRLVFAKFEELGTLHALLCWLVAADIELGGRHRCGPDRGELVWRRPNRTVLRNMIRNPTYAGIYAYGRKHSELGATGRHEHNFNDPADWLVFLPDRLPAYISVEQWRRNLARLQANRNTAATPGSARRGQALLSGLVRCARCGTRMTVSYRTEGDRNRHVYQCNWENVHYGGRPCQQLAGACLDDWVTGLVLTALAPAALELSLTAAERLEHDRAAVDKIWRQRLERADYEVDRARRCYRLAEPENRLVVRQLEADWESVLAAREALRADYARFTTTTPRTLTTTEKESIRALAADIPGLWQAPTTTLTERKQLLRLIIEHIDVGVAGDSEQVTATITWAGGQTTTGGFVRPVARYEQLSYYPQLMARVKFLAEKGTSTREIVEILDTEGFRPPKRAERFGMQNVHDLLRRLGFLKPQGHTMRGHRDHLLGENDWWMVDLAAKLSIATSTLHNWIVRGWVTARRAPIPSHPWIVWADAAELDRITELHTRPNGYYTRHLFLDNQTHAGKTNEEGDHGKQSTP